MPTPRATDGEKDGPNQRGSFGGPDATQRSDVDWEPMNPLSDDGSPFSDDQHPDPTELSRNGGRRLSPALRGMVMMGLPDGWVCDVPGLTRNAQMKALGNGVVPQQAAAALAMMGGFDG